MRVLYAAALLVASGIFPACEKKQVWRGAGVELTVRSAAKPALFGDEANGRVELGPVRLSWDLDPRALRFSGGTVEGHPARVEGASMTWHCDKTQRTFHLDGAVESVNCHPRALATHGDVPRVAVAQLPFRLASRKPGFAAYTSDQRVLTLFAGQQAFGPRDPSAAAEAAPDWLAVAGLSDAVVSAAETSSGPQGHPGLLVRGTARVGAQPVRFAALFWRCLQRQKSFVAVSFAPEGDVEAPLLAARCHG